MRASDDNQDCPVWGTSGLRLRIGTRIASRPPKRKRIAYRHTRPADRCLACNGDGAISTKRLRGLVLAGVHAIAADR
jgi:hypothetical protein